MIKSRKLAYPRLNSVREVVNRSQFTDGGGTSGTYQLEAAIPVGAYILASRALVPIAFIGDTSATLVIGDGTDVDRYNTGTPSVFTAAATAGIDLGVPSGVKVHTAAVRPTLTVTSAADFTNVTAGQLVIEVVYIEFGEGRPS